MSVMEKVFGMFGGGNNNQQSGQQNPQQQQPQNTPQNLPPSPVQSATQGNGVVPNTVNTNPAQPDNNSQGNNPAVADVAKSPLDQFSKLWENDPNAKAPQDQSFNVDPAKLMDAASKVDFAKVITQEQLTAIAGGGEGAVKAFSESLNKIAQTVYAQSAVASSEIVKQALKQAEIKFAAQIPSLVKRHQMSDSLRTDNPAFSHPAAQPIINALEQQFTTKYPDATASELRALATSYLSSFSEVANPPKATPDTGKGKKSNETDWSNFLDS